MRLAVVGRQLDVEHSIADPFDDLTLLPCRNAEFGEAAVANADSTGVLPPIAIPQMLPPYLLWVFIIGRGCRLI